MGIKRKSGHSRSKNQGGLTPNLLSRHTLPSPTQKTRDESQNVTSKTKSKEKILAENAKSKYGSGEKCAPTQQEYDVKTCLDVGAKGIGKRGSKEPCSSTEDLVGKRPSAKLKVSADSSHPHRNQVLAKPDRRVGHRVQRVRKAARVDDSQGTVVSVHLSRCRY